MSNVSKQSRRRFLASSAAAVASLLAAGPSEAQHSVNWRNLNGRSRRNGSTRRLTRRSSYQGRNRRGGGAHCFAKGAHILTAAGEVPIESLSAGDHILTFAGQERKIQWIGHSIHFPDQSGSWNSNEIPIRISQYAIDAMTPHRDLLVSPEHAIYLDGLLIPARYLVNGTKISPVDATELDCVEYYHLELSSHDVLVAEGAPAESFRDIGLRGALLSSDEPTEIGEENTPASNIEPYAPIVAMRRRRDIFASHMRSALSPIMDRRTPFELVRDRLANRAFEAVQ